jgi:hypothetical protein
MSKKGRFSDRSGNEKTVRTRLCGANAFILSLLSLLFLTAATDAHVWPFMAFDMFSGNFAIVEIYGKTQSGAMVKISPDCYFQYLTGYFFTHALFDYHETSPEQFARILHELKLRYNSGSHDPVELLRVYAYENEKGARSLGDYL